MPNNLEKYVLLIGSDLGNRTLNLKTAVELIAAQIGAVIAASAILETEPWGFESKTRFLNQAILVETALAPELLLETILDIERIIGRERTETQWISRIIDIDILCGQNIVLQSDNLTIPHKHLHVRSFALKPLCELVPNWKHPILDMRYEEIHLSLP